MHSTNCPSIIQRYHPNWKVYWINEGMNSIWVITFHICMCSVISMQWGNVHWIHYCKWLISIDISWIQCPNTHIIRRLHSNSHSSCSTYSQNSLNSMICISSIPMNPIHLNIYSKHSAKITSYQGWSLIGDYHWNKLNTMRVKHSPMYSSWRMIIWLGKSLNLRRILKYYSMI